MDFEPNEQQRMIQGLARDFAQNEIVPYARDWDRKEEFPWPAVRKMAELGLLGGPLPADYGGMGLDYITYALMTEEIGKACSSVRTVLSVHISLVQKTLLKWGTDEQRQRWLPRMTSAEVIGCYGLTEPNAGSDPAGMETMAVKDGDDWILNGSKMWISNGGIAQLALVFAQTDKSRAHRGITAFVVDDYQTPGWSTKDIHGKLGLRASNTAELHMADVRVPDANRLGQIGDGFKIAMSALDNGRYSVAAGCVGIAQGCIDASVEHAQTRKQFGKPIGAFQQVQALIADMVVETEAARLLVLKAGQVKDQGKPSTTETSIAKLYATEVANRAAYNAIQVHGGYGYSDEYPVERYYRDARVATLYEGTSQIQKLIIGRAVTGIDAFV